MAGNPTDSDQFLGLLVHDLRAIVSQGLIRSQLLQTAAGQLDVDSRGHLAAIVESQRLSSQFLAKLADYCHADAGLNRIPRVNCKMLLDNAIRLAGLSESEVVIASLPADPVPAALQKVFFELMDNARKFHSADPLSIHFSATRTELEHIIEIRDNGIGFDEKYGDLIWEPLKRLHGLGVYPGFGLGLAICRRIIAGLNGRMWAVSSPGEGATFYCAIPADLE